MEIRIPGVMEGQRLDNPVSFIVLDERGNVLRTEPNPDFVYEESETYLDEILVERDRLTDEILGWLLGYKSDAVRMQQVSWMASYNANNLYGTSGRPALPKPFRSVVGSDVDSAIWDSDSYCGGYTENVGLETTQNWLNSCSDGFLNCTSQSAAGSVWFW